MARILVIDDDDIDRQVVIDTLKTHNHEVFEINTPIGATQAILRNRINCVVLDVMMPAISGDKLARMFRENKKIANIAIILITSHDTSKFSGIVRECKINALLHKQDVANLPKIVETVTDVDFDSLWPK